MLHNNRRWSNVLYLPPLKSGYLPLSSYIFLTCETYIFIIILLWWMAVPYALGESTEQDRCVVDSLREAIRLKDSLYSKASVETLAKYNAEFGNDQLQEENHFVSRSRTYIIILNIMLLAVAVVLVLRQRRLIALQKARHLLDTISPETTILDVALKCGYEDQGAFGRAFKRFFGITPSDYLARNEENRSKMR